MSKNFFGSFEHGGWFKINKDLYINMPNSWEYREGNDTVYVGLINKRDRKFCELPDELKTGEQVCRWIIFDLLPTYEEWKIKGGRTPWEMTHKTDLEEFLCSIVFPYYPFSEENISLCLKIINGKIMTVLGDKIIEELPGSIHDEYELNKYLRSFFDNEYPEKAIKCCKCKQLYEEKDMVVYTSRMSSKCYKFFEKDYICKYCLEEEQTQWKEK